MELKLFEVLDLNMDLHLHECFWDGLRINYCKILCEFTITSRFFCNVIVNTTRACDTFFVNKTGTKDFPKEKH